MIKLKTIPFYLILILLLSSMGCQGKQKIYFPKNIKEPKWLKYAQISKPEIISEKYFVSTVLSLETPKKLPKKNKKAKPEKLKCPNKAAEKISEGAWEIIRREFEPKSKIDHDFKEGWQLFFKKKMDFSKIDLVESYSLPNENLIFIKCSWTFDQLFEAIGMDQSLNEQIKKKIPSRIQTRIKNIIKNGSD